MAMNIEQPIGLSFSNVQQSSAVDANHCDYLPRVTNAIKNRAHIYVCHKRPDGFEACPAWTLLQHSGVLQWSIVLTATLTATKMTRMRSRKIVQMKRRHRNKIIAPVVKNKLVRFPTPSQRQQQREVSSKGKLGADLQYQRLTDGEYDVKQHCICHIKWKTRDRPLKQIGNSRLSRNLLICSFENLPLHKH